MLSAAPVDEHGAPYFLVLSMLMLAPATWERHRRALLQLALRRRWLEEYYGTTVGPRRRLPFGGGGDSAADAAGGAGAGAANASLRISVDLEELGYEGCGDEGVNTPGDDSRAGADASSQLLASARPMLVFFGLVEQLSRALKPRNMGSARSSLAEEGGPDEPWVASMQEHLMDFDAMMKVMIVICDDFSACTVKAIRACVFRERNCF